MRNATIDVEIRQALDREAIRDLPRRYCHYVWQENFDAYLDLFAEDGWAATSDSKLLPRVQGREEFRKLIERTVAELMPRPFIHNHVIELTGPDTAGGTCYVEVRMLKDGKSSLMLGWYDDEYVKVGEVWKFKSRVATLLDGYS